MLWPGGPFHFVTPISVRVKDAQAAARWYGGVLNLNCVTGWDQVPIGMTDNKNKSNPGAQIIFLPASGGPLASEATKHPIIFTRDIDEAHLWLSKQTSSTGPIQADSSGNRFFVFRDLDENQIEVCRDTHG
jgi:catechol 2,3-dioxygenase-like lactoylglutathione lyase family enzyme